MSKGMEHLNGGQICVIDTETTGLDCNWHEMVQICIMPLDSDLKPRKDVSPFYIMLNLESPERADRKAMKINRLKFAEIVSKGFDREKAKDLLEDWIKKLGLPYTNYGNPKKIYPLGQNYQFDKGFITAWLGKELYDEYFHYHYRDTMIAAHYLNDHSAFHTEPIPFPKVNLKYLASQLKIDTSGAHDALADCLMTAQVYRKMVTQGLMA